MKHPVITIAKYTFLEAVRNRLFILLVLGVTGIFGLAVFVGELAITDTAGTQASIIAFILRISAVVVTILYVVSGVLREFNDKTINLIISLPVPRHNYYFGKLAGFCLLCVAITLIAGLPLWLYADPAQVILWQTSLLCELLIITGVCLFFVFTLENMPVAITAVLAFYILSRSINTILLISRSPILESEGPSQAFIAGFLELLAFVLPAIDRFARTDWLVYASGHISDMVFIMGQSFIYLVLLMSVALFDLYRKNF